MILRHLWAGLALAAVVLASGCSCCHKSSCGPPPVVASAPPCCAPAPAPCCGAGSAPVQAYSVPVAPAPGGYGH